MKRYAKALTAALLVGLLLSGCSLKEEPQQAQIELLEPVGVELDSAVAYVGELNQMAVYHSAVVPAVEEMYMTVDGTIKKLHVTLGDWVKKGDVLLELDESELQKAYDELSEQIEYTQTMNEYNNRLAQLDIDILKNQLRALENSGQESTPEHRQALELKRLEIEQAELNLRQRQETQQLSLSNQQKDLERLQEKLGKNLLIAPFDGQVVYALSVREGDWLAAYRPVAYLADNSRLSLSGESISTMQIEGASDLYALIEGQRHEITYAPLSKEDYIALVLDGSKVPANFTFQAGGSPDGVEAGQYAAICIVSKQVDDALLIPTNALMRDSGGRYVYVLDENGARAKRSVRTGMSTAWLTQITEGLEEGEVVYVKN